MMLYLLAIGSTTNLVPASAWDAISRPTFPYGGLTYITNFRAPLFIHQYSHDWFDFRNKTDKYANYFANSVTATQAHELFCQSLQLQFKDYQSNLWGITASDSVNGYTVWGGPRAWQRYGFVDAFNPLTGWYDSDALGIDAGITMLMAENQRSSFVWNTFMANPEAQSAFAALGLK
jgi:hypothetical protein